MRDGLHQDLGRDPRTGEYVDELHLADGSQVTVRHDPVEIEREGSPTHLRLLACGQSLREQVGAARAAEFMEEWRQHLFGDTAEEHSPEALAREYMALARDWRWQWNTLNADFRELEQRLAAASRPEEMPAWVAVLAYVALAALLGLGALWSVV